jgi:tricorn protease-like protein
VVFVSDGLAERRTLALDGLGGSLAITSGGTKVVAVMGRQSGVALIFLDSQTHTEIDISTLVSFSLTSIQRLGTSADGQYVAIASDDSLCIIDVPSRKVRITTRGRYPSISSDGRTVAFVRDDALFTQAILGGSPRVISTGLLVNFVGGWSPNGRLLLFGGHSRFSDKYRLIVMDAKTYHLAELQRQDGEITPEVFWIKRRFSSL